MGITQVWYIGFFSKGQKLKQNCQNFRVERALSMMGFKFPAALRNLSCNSPNRGTNILCLEILLGTPSLYWIKIYFPATWTQNFHFYLWNKTGQDYGLFHVIIFQIYASPFNSSFSILIIPYLVSLDIAHWHNL